MSSVYFSCGPFSRCVASALFFAAGAAVASGSQTMVAREPGLWEIQLKQDSPLTAIMQSMQAELARMPPAQRRQMEQMMGSMMGTQASKPMAIQQCLTPEMAARELEPQVDPDMTCKNASRVVSATEVHFSFTCQNSDGQWAGEGRAWDVSARGYQSEFTMQGAVNGKPMKIDMSHTAKWIGEDCRGVKP